MPGLESRKPKSQENEIYWFQIIQLQLEGFFKYSVIVEKVVSSNIASRQSISASLNLNLGASFLYLINREEQKRTNLDVIFRSIGKMKLDFNNY